MNTRNIKKLSITTAGLVGGMFSFFTAANAEKYPPRLTHLADPTGVPYAVNQLQNSNGYANDGNVMRAIDAMVNEHGMIRNPPYVPLNYDTQIKSWPADSFGYDYVTLLRNGPQNNTELEADLIKLLDIAQKQIENRMKDAGIFTGIFIACVIGVIGIGFAIACLVCSRRRQDTSTQQAQTSTNEEEKITEEEKVTRNSMGAV